MTVHTLLGNFHKNNKPWLARQRVSPSLATKPHPSVDQHPTPTVLRCASHP
jgi:hypothetical protein